MRRCTKRIVLVPTEEVAMKAYNDYLNEVKSLAAAISYFY